IAPVPKLLAAGINVALGTDGCASNNDLNLFGEMDTCAKLHKVATLDPTTMAAPTVLRLATAGGARALGLGDSVGTLEPGRLADLIAVDFQQPHLTPVYDPVSHLVYAAGPADVRHSVIGGRVVLKDRVIQTLDLEQVLHHARRIARIVRS
ncbi:MAG: S-adenosylhomocysteine deaminase, partial [Syntrophobacteraceae bacterium CG07_land_8_20_14_0_80_61_8]